MWNIGDKLNLLDCLLNCWTDYYVVYKFKSLNHRNFCKVAALQHVLRVHSYLVTYVPHNTHPTTTQMQHGHAPWKSHGFFAAKALWVSPLQGSICSLESATSSLELVNLFIYKFAEQHRTLPSFEFGWTAVHEVAGDCSVHRVPAHTQYDAIIIPRQCHHVMRLCGMLWFEPEGVVKLRESGCAMQHKGTEEAYMWRA